MTRCILLLTAALAAGAGYAADTNVRVLISSEVAPGVYGRVDFGSAPPPPVVYEKPIIITRVERAPQPVYLHVPPGHAKNWKKHCKHYNACDVPVYFVRSAEYPDAKGKKKAKKDKD